MTSYSASSIPPNPTLRSSTLNTVIVVPLLTSTTSTSSPTLESSALDYNTHSYQSFQNLFSSLGDINLERQQSNKPNFRSSLRRQNTSSSLGSTNNNNHHHKSSATSSSSPSSSELPKHNAAIAAIQAASAPSKEITLIIPNSNLTPPSEFRYDSTPLKSHDWTMGCQRLLFLNGLHSVQAQDRYKSFGCGSDNYTNNNKSSTKRIPSHYGHFVDLYPSRGVSAVIGVINVKDCNTNLDFQKAERELEEWVLKFTPTLHYEKSFLGHDQSTADSSNRSPMAPRHFITKRLFIFDSFDEECLARNIVDVSNTTYTKPNESVAFPPLENMNLHLNVVVNDLSVAIFMALERRIKVIDQLCNDDFDETKKKNKENNISKKKKDGGSGGGGAAADVERSNVGAILNLSFGSKSTDTEDDNIDVLKTHSQDDHYYTTTSVDGNIKKKADNISMDGNKPSGNKTLGLISAVRHVFDKQPQSKDIDEAEQILPPIEHELQTPLDTIIFQGIEITAKDAECIFKRNAARREKYTADLALLAGSVMDAYDRYTRAAEVLKNIHDPLWYAGALEGIATSFVAMSDTGGHGADMYLERNFQYPVKVMEAALVASGVKTNDLYDRVDRSKTTMPEAVTALLKEACDIMSRNIKLSSIYSELLLKMAWYIGEMEGVHLLCKWGEGFSGGNGQDDAYGVAMTAAISGQQKRWEHTSVSKIPLEKLQDVGKLDALFCQNAIDQCRRFTETLHRTASNGGLDSFTRAGVGARCALLCLKGVRVPQWLASKATKKSSFRRQHFPRKAAYFSVLAAESMSQCKVTDAPKCAAGFWAAASHLYSKEGNKFDGDSAYAWACLRVTMLNAMSLHGGAVASEVATKELYQLLGEITQRNEGIGRTKENKKNSRSHHRHEYSKHKTISSDSLDDGSIMAEKGSKKEALRSSIADTLTRPKTKNPLFAHSGSALLMQQSEWIHGDDVPLLILPLIEPSSMVLIATSGGQIKLMKKNVKNYHILPPLLSLDCALQHMDLNVCIEAQKQCMLHLSKLRSSLPASSVKVLEQFNLSPEMWLREQTSIIQIKSAKIIKSESHLLMDKLKAAGFVGKMTTSAATFYNPYEKKQHETTGKNIITLVAQGEERTITVQICNNLSVPITIPSCQIAFKKPNHIDIEAPPLSFIVPPKTKAFCVNFPFIVVSSDTRKDEYSSDAYSFAATGLRVTANNRSLYVPFPKAANDEFLPDNVNKHPQIPPPASTYQRRSNKKGNEKQFSVDLEAVPPQPNLLVSFAAAPAPLEDAATVPVHLSDGEIYSIPPFCLENDVGLGRGTMERLQVLAVGMPGLPEEILFDTDQMAKALEEEEDRFSDTDSDENENESFDELMESDGLPPLKIKCLAEGLSLKSINDRNKSLGEGSMVTFQVAATHDMGNQLKNGGNVRIRFRYRGPSPIPGVEIWRKREIALRIVRVKGPRISSLTFRSDLSWGSEFSDLCRSLSLQKSRLEKVPNWESSKLIGNHNLDDFSINPPSELTFEAKEEDWDVNEAILNRVGQHSGVFVSRDDVIVLMAVANDTNSTIIFSNRSGNVGGFKSSPMHTVKVTSGVSVKIPVVIPRIDCLDENGNVADIATELIARTALQWESELVDSEDKADKGKRQGRVRIPSRCLRELIENHNFFATRICKPPVKVTASFNGETNTEMITLSPGATLDAKVQLGIEDWVPKNLSSKCSLVLEFACARKYSGKSDQQFENENNGAFIWCGQVRKSVQISDNMQHKARLCFLCPGDFVTSACVKICGQNGQEEVWWAPSSKHIKVCPSKQ